MKKLLLAFLLIANGVVQAQDTEVAKFKALFTLNFIRYIGWAEASKEGDFVIGVVRESAVAEQLRSQTAGKKFGLQPIVIKEFKSVEEIIPCQMIFFSEKLSFPKYSATLKDKLNNKNSLIITETEGAIDQGSMINFVVRDSKLKFEISAANAEKFGLQFSNSLLSLSNAIVK